jgi:hypothetical protein
MWRPRGSTQLQIWLSVTLNEHDSLKSTLVCEVELLCSLQLKSYTNSITEEMLEKCFAIGSNV